MKKLITVSVPVYNEQDNIRVLYDRTTAVCEKLTDYEYEIVFFDDGSTDGSRDIIEALAAEDSHVRAVFYTRNFGYSKNIFYSMQQAKGDCAILLHADLQNPPELIPELVKKWEEGAQIVQGVKSSSKENRFMYLMRTLFYILMDKLFGVPLVRHATEFELFDRSFLDLLKEIKHNKIFLRNIVIEYGQKTEYVKYVQDKRRAGRSKFNLNKYYDLSIEAIVDASRCLPRRIIAVCGVLLALLIAESVFFFVRNSAAMTLPQIENSIIIRVILAGILCLSVLLCFIFEYIIGVLERTETKPFICEERRINY